MSCTAFITKDKALLHSSSHHPVRLCRAVHYCQGQSVTSSFGMLLWVPLTGWGQAVFGKGQMWKRWSSGGVCAKWGERHSSSVFYLWGLDWQICIWFRGLWLQLILITCPPPPPPLPSRSLQLPLLRPYNPALRPNKANTHPETQASHYVRLTTTSAQRKRDSLPLCTFSQSIRAGCEVLLCWFWRDSNYLQIKLKCYGNCLSMSLEKRGKDGQMLREEPYGGFQVRSGARTFCLPYSLTIFSHIVNKIGSFSWRPN